MIPAQKTNRTTRGKEAGAQQWLLSQRAPIGAYANTCTAVILKRQLPGSDNGRSLNGASRGDHGAFVPLLATPQPVMNPTGSAPPLKCAQLLFPKGCHSPLIFLCRRTDLQGQVWRTERALETSGDLGRGCSSLYRERILHAEGAPPRRRPIHLPVWV